LEHRDTLLTIAEIAVALAGFASLVSVIGGRQNDTSRVFASLRLRTMLEVAFRNTFFALLPLPFLQLAPSDPILWRISSGLYIATTIGYFFLRRRENESTRERWLSLSTRILFSITILAGLANVLGLGGANAFSLYLANLLLGLWVAGLYFVSVSASVFGIERD
jgi:hypothetical protein